MLKYDDMIKDNPTQQPKLVRDLMTVGVLTCSQETSIKTIAKALLEKDVEAVVVLDPEGHAVGHVSRDELVRAYAYGSYESLQAHDIMREGIPVIPPDIPIGAAVQLMQDQGIRVFYLTHHAGGIEYPAAFISYKHFLRHIQSETGEDLKDLGIDAARKPPLEQFIERREANRNKDQNTHLQ